MNKIIKRCDWANNNPLEQRYHDTKWGIPVFYDKELFKMLCLEGMQAVGMVNDHLLDCEFRRV